MLEVSDSLRKAYITLLSGLTIDGIVIPVFDERVTGATARLGQAEAYILLHSQTETDKSPKCNFETECSIQVDINTKFQAQTGGKLLSERISNEVKKRIYPDPGIELPMGDDFQCYSTRLNMSRGLVEYNSTNDNYRKIIIFLHTINQLTT